MGLLLAGCSSLGTSGAAHQPNAQLANAYLASGATWVNYIQWNTSGVGTFTADTLTGTAPNEQVSSDQTPITASVNGGEITFTGLQQDTGTLANGTLTLQVLSHGGTLGTDTFSPATQDQFNQAASGLQTQANNDNTASANASTEQQAQKDLAAGQAIGFTSDLNSLGNDVTTANSGLGTVKSDAGNGQGSDCSNADTVESDFDQVVSDSDSFSGDLDGFTSRVSGARQAISTLQSDLSGLSAANLPAPSGASAAISSAKGAISSAISTTNGDISQVNGDVSDAAQVLSSLATGSCSNIGIPNTPSPAPTVS
jgi:hypothetical protein